MAATRTRPKEETMDLTSGFRRCIRCTVDHRTAVRGVVFALAAALLVAVLASRARSAAAAEDDKPTGGAGIAWVSGAGGTRDVETPPAGTTILTTETEDADHETDGDDTEYAIVAVDQPAGPKETPDLGNGDYMDDDVPAGDAVPADDPVLVAPPIVDPEPGGIIVAKFDCLEDYDGDYDALSDNCVRVHSGITFHLFSVNGEEIFDAGIAVDGIYAGPLEIVEEIPAGYGVPRVFCDAFTAADGGATVAAVEVFEGGVYWELGSGERLFCKWYNIPLEEDGEGEDIEIVVDKYACPAGFDADDADHDQLAETCVEQQDGVGFAIYDVETELDAGATGDSVSGRAKFWNLPSGWLSILESVPEGYGVPVVYCGLGDVGGNVAEYVRLDVIDEHRVGWELFPGEILWCDWYNVPDAGDANTVDVAKRVCPVGADPYELSLDELYVLCTEAVAGVDFHLSGGDTPDREETTDDQGAAVWFDVAPDSPSWLWEELPAGYGEPIVSCAWSNELTGDQGIEFGDVSWFDGNPRITFAVEGYGNVRSCDWFNVPSDDQTVVPTVVVKKWVCPDGSDPYALSIDELFALCDEVLSGIAFHLGGGGGDQEEITDVHGRSSWYDVAPGEYGLWEEVPPGYDHPIAYCRLISPNGSASGFTELQSYDGNPGVAIELANEGNGWYCDWFNVPGVQDDGGEDDTPGDDLPDDDTPDDFEIPTQLPNTGTGSAQDAGDDGATAALVLAVAAQLVGLAVAARGSGAGLCRMPARSRDRLNRRRG